MKRIRSIGALVAAATAMWAQEGHLSVSRPSWNGLEIWFVTKLEPPGTQLPGGASVGKGGAYHMITDAAHKRTFGYMLELEPDAAGKTARIRIERMNPGDPKVGPDPRFTYLELPNYPVIPNVKVGDTVALDLLVNHATGQKVVDYLTLRRAGDMDLERQPRDFQLSDVELSLLGPRVRVSGQAEQRVDGGGTSGAVVWLYLDGRGRFILTLAPHERLGFRKNGVVSRNGLLFHDGAAEIRMECNARIAPGGGAYNLYVLQERNWRPPDGGRLRIGSADRVELVAGQK